MQISCLNPKTAKTGQISLEKEKCQGFLETKYLRKWSHNILFGYWLWKVYSESYNKSLSEQEWDEEEAGMREER